MISASPKKRQIDRVWSLHFLRLPLLPSKHHAGASDRPHTASASSDPGVTAPKVINSMHPQLECTLLRDID